MTSTAGDLLVLVGAVVIVESGVNEEETGEVVSVCKAVTAGVCAEVVVGAVAVEMGKVVDAVRAILVVINEIAADGVEVSEVKDNVLAEVVGMTVVVERPANGVDCFELVLDRAVAVESAVIAV